MSGVTAPALGGAERWRRRAAARGAGGSVRAGPFDARAGRPRRSAPAAATPSASSGRSRRRRDDSRSASRGGGSRRRRDDSCSASRSDRSALGVPAAGRSGGDAAGQREDEVPCVPCENAAEKPKTRSRSSARPRVR
ncbi:hypothetical protein SO694_00192027 [Aureococcus anophagefferens]|uniref:Uncharacterized protein n=1 Tax=Aureococcus anophagefferens TaxID=44056 RepID=A0ABR1FNX9_AURAN